MKEYKKEGPVMIVHGPEPFDNGFAKTMAEKTKPSVIIAAGIMARTAAEESGLKVVCPGIPPSAIINSVPPKMPLFLVNSGKNEESGRIFGEIVAGRINPRGLLHIENGLKGSIIYNWDFGDPELLNYLFEVTGFEIRNVSSGDGSACVSGNIKRIRGCVAGEPVFVNGIVIGQATASEVIIEVFEDNIRAVSGILIKEHGIEKLLRRGKPNPGDLWCKSGAIRNKSARSVNPENKSGNICVVDHSAHECYEKTDENTAGILSVGDDTTAVCCHICSHLGIPVFGVTDGDCDHIVPESYPPNSVIISLNGERDDDVGVEIVEKFGLPCVYGWNEFVESVLLYLGKRAERVFDGR
ncbi:DUF2117 domain-containing protein [Methanoplanus sp. FWC-SCC4]|uniref:DUF2117 domain-containing protein n=1 Tax=Methanochimaera problematica TaxID=2609417 RepID=A0AA97FA31_9EURY|nr:DUF2117 domain-containing protein [Methanoplanus sp. FWC-SCC4]WOF15352.1 DUF2117 domain-containing protein [Methanoplanus sp. FWC-SCC4]